MRNHHFNLNQCAKNDHPWRVSLHQKYASAVCTPLNFYSFFVVFVIAAAISEAELDTLPIVSSQTKKH